MSEWKAWNGGVMPVNCDEVLYRVRHSPDKVLGPTPPAYLRWDHGRTPESAADPTLRHSDIIAYCVVPWRERTPRTPIADTHPKGGDAEQAPLVSGGGDEVNRPKDTPQ